MNLNFSLLEQPISFEKALIFVIEDVEVFSKVVHGVYQYGENSMLKFFNDKLQLLKPSELMVVTDILSFDSQAPTTLKLIYSDLEQQLNENIELKSRIDQLTTRVQEWISEELLEHELDLVCEEMSMVELFKALKIRITTQPESIFQKIMEILQIYKYLVKKKCLVFNNVGAYLTTTEMAELQEYISLCHMPVLFIEPRKIKGLKQTVLDQDYFLCEEMW